MTERLIGQRIETINIIPRSPLDLSIVIRCGRDKRGLERCLDSVDENVEIVVSVANDAPFLRDVEESGYKLAPHTYGNWSLATQTGIDWATNNDVIIMDADSVFGERSIGIINQALKDGHLLVQPRVVFLTDGSYVSRLISTARTFENRREPKSYSPGLGLKIEELTERIGIEGKIYNLSVAYGDDGDLDQRRRKAGIEVFVAENALIYHNPIRLEHELRTSYRFGVGERQAQVGKPYPKTVFDILKEEFFSEGAKDYYLALYQRHGLAALFFMTLCRSAYLAGYYTEDARVRKVLPSLNEEF